MPKKEKAGFLLFLLLGTAFLLLTDFFLLDQKKAYAPPDTSNLKISQITGDDKKLTAALQQLGIRKTMEILLAESAGGSNFDCHQQAHKIGRIGYHIFKAEAFRQSDASCHSGAYHGAMETFLNEQGTENLASNIDKICKDFDTSFGQFECLHGVGHGVLAYLDYDLQQTVDECKKLNGSFAQNSCFGGMFMENILTAQGLGAGTGDHTTNWAKQDDPHFPCSIFDQEDILVQCYQMQTSWMLTLSKYSFEKVAAECQNAPKSLISTCFRSYGRDAAGTVLRNPKGIIEKCSLVPDSYLNECILGAENVIVDFWGPNLQNQATELCKMVTKDDVKNACYSNLASRLPGLFESDPKIYSICNSFEPKYRQLCEW